ncbi:hypothetical protein AAFN86_17825 [Roseomonas sp. CAU 1739]|uniref:hypothetical protein n=1 Tax=Roseomonas sp. CAU 1739 TaxID=3140364 RepID=UPI00325A5FD8
MRVVPPALAVLASVALGGCVQYPNGTWGPPLAQAPLPPMAYMPPPPPPVVYAPPAYGYNPGVPVYVVPQQPVYAAPPVSIGIGLGWGWGWGGWGRGYYGRPYYGRRW